MKKTLPLTIILVTVFFSNVVFAGNPGGDTPNLRFKSSDEEVSFEVEREKGEVLMYLMVKDLTQYHHIVIERSAETPNYFGKCKYIVCAEKSTSDGYIQESDRFPFSPSKDVYYRVKTVTNDGIERAYPAVLLAAAK